MKMEGNIMETLIRELKKLNAEYTIEKNRLVVKCDLDLSGTNIKKLPKNLTIGGSLDLYRSSIKELPENLTVSGFLDLSDTPIKKLPEGLTVGWCLDLSGTDIKELPENLTVGGYLDLSSTNIEELPENLIVGGDLYLSNTDIKKLPENLIVGGDLDLSCTDIKELPKGLTVEGDIIPRNSYMDQRLKIKHLTNGTYVEGKYLYADEILTLVKKKKKFGNYTIYIGKIPNQFVISNGVNYAHCSSLREGISDLEFKETLNRRTDQYKTFNLDTVVTLEEAKTMYRIITGACKFGTDRFVDNLSERKETYTVRECIELTKGQYNADVFASFFNK